MVGACHGTIENGAKALLGEYYVPNTGVGWPTGPRLHVENFPEIPKKDAGQYESQVQVPIFGGVAIACFGPAIMAIAGPPGPNIDAEETAFAYATFPLNLNDPQPSRTLLPTRVWQYDQGNGVTYDYFWDGTVTVRVGR